MDFIVVVVVDQKDFTLIAVEYSPAFMFSIAIFYVGRMRNIA